ncbi:MAG: class I SAM-dependent methyltransferase [Candidatus Berkiella sp.]
MTIYKTESLIETYRHKARSKDINELTGRTGRPDLTAYVINQISEKIPVNRDSVLIDIGCGDGLLLKKIAQNGIDGYTGRLIGILPTKEEVSRVRDHILQTANVGSPLISIEYGMSEKTGIPDNYGDIVICNSVLHGAGQSLDNVEASLREFGRILKVGGMLYIGELPQCNEIVNSLKYTGDSIIGWLFWVLKKQGFSAFKRRLKQTLVALFTKEPFLIVPKTMFYMSVNDFIDLLEKHGFEVKEYFKHKEINHQGQEYDSATRVNYVAFKRA